MFMFQKKLFINADALSEQYIISPLPPPQYFQKVHGQEKEGVIVEQFFPSSATDGQYRN